ncbi:sulfur carrier protein ThiS [Candidatus Margulisiibacteriota bacterium]
MIVNVVMNGKSEQLKDVISVAAFIKSRGLKTEAVVVELNGQVVNRSDYDQIRINDNDQLELIQYMGGG